MDVYHVKGTELIYLSSHATLQGSKAWGTKYAAWKYNGASRESSLVVMDNGVSVAWRTNGKWLCCETDKRRRAKCGSIELGSIA